MASRAEAEERLDYDFHVRAGRGYGLTLAELGVAVVSGSIEVTGASGFPVFHTIDFPKGEGRRALVLSTGDGVPSARCVIAEPGDILLARVDRSLERKVCGIASGAMAISSSVFRLRAPSGCRGAVLDALLSAEGEVRIAATARGVGARMLGKDDLLNMCLPL